MANNLWQFMVIKFNENSGLASEIKIELNTKLPDGSCL